MNPGPSVAIDSQDDDGSTLRLGISNPTGMRQKEQQILELGEGL